MSNHFPSERGDFPGGATMRPQYMGRTMTTYPVSEPEMDQISILSAQVTTRFTVASFLFALGAGIWTNAMFATDLTPEGRLASHYVAPLLLVFSIGFAIAGLWARRNRTSTWAKIKADATPVQTIVEAGGLMIAGNRQTAGRRAGR